MGANLRASSLILGDAPAQIKTFDIACPSAMELAEQAIFLSEEGFAYDRDGVPLPFSVPTTPEALANIKAEVGGTLDDVFRERNTRAIVRNECPYIPAFIYGYWNYYHLLIDCIPRVLLSLAAAKGAPRILVTECQDAKLKRHQRDILTQMANAFGLQQVIDIVSGDFFRLDRAIIPNRSPRFIGAAITLFSKVEPARNRGQRRRVFVSRKFASGRRVLNEDEIIDIVSGFGFEVVHLEGMTFGEQIALFREAQVVMGPHGAGFANVVFCSPGTTLIEFLQQTAAYKAGIFAELAALAGCEHVVFLAKPADDFDRVDRVANGDMMVDGEELERILSAFIDNETSCVRKPHLEVQLSGDLGDRMIQYLLARRISSEAGGCCISNAGLPDWRISHLQVPAPAGKKISISGDRVDVSSVASLLFSREVVAVDMNARGRWLSNLPDLESCRRIFQSDESLSPGFGSDYLVCDIGTAVNDSLQDHNPFLPVEFYAELASRNRWKLAFIGYFADNTYCRLLHRRFPDAVFHENRGRVADFEILLNSKNLVPAVDTLSWLGAWLSHADVIELPVIGLFHPVQNPDIDLLPLADKRYRFYLFPINYSVPTDGFEQAHLALRGWWRYMRPDAIAELRSSIPRWPRRLDRFLQAFDEQFYLRTNADIAEAVRLGAFNSGIEHYIKVGFRAGRSGFPLDERWYIARYPLAAVEVGQGDYVDLAHHYAEVGLARGYKPQSGATGRQHPFAGRRLPTDPPQLSRRSMQPPNKAFQHVAAQRTLAHAEDRELANAVSPEWKVDRPSSRRGFPESVADGQDARNPTLGRRSHWVEPVIDVHLAGGFSHRMIQYVAVHRLARRIAAECGGCRISNVALPEWGISHPAMPGTPSPEFEIPIRRNDFDIESIAQLMSSGHKTHVIFESQALWFPNFPELDFCRNIFPPNEPGFPGFGPEYLVCSVEVFDPEHRNNVLLPVSFYAELAQTTGLRLAFVGSIEDNSYCNELKKHFPDAAFHPSRGCFADFQTFRNSKNLVPGVGTFSWMAAWLSRAEMIILPVSGLFHPVQCREIDLLPQGDERVQFYLFPINYAVPVDEFSQAHRAIQGRWRCVGAETLSGLRVARWPRRLDSFLSMFDEAFYLQNHSDAAEAVRHGRVKSGRDHYREVGFKESRGCFALDPLWYSTEYPIAALEVGQGDYADFLHHYVEVGAKRGYKPLRGHAGANAVREQSFGQLAVRLGA